MTWLVLATEADESARWAAEGLGRVGFEPLTLILDVELAGARWSHRIERGAVTTDLQLADGRSIDSTEVRGTLNRLTFLPPVIVEPLVADDRLYGLQELSALVMSWLASLAGPLVNPPDPRGFGGAWRAPAEWAVLAHDAGLACAPVYADSADDRQARQGGWRLAGPHAALGEDVIVVGNAVFSHDGLDPAEVVAFRRLAELSGTPMLGAVFAGDGGHHVAGVTPLPDLRAGGDGIIAALAEALAGERVGT